MTTAIEQTKREMYKALADVKGRICINYSVKNMRDGINEYEGSLEDHLEQLRQQYEQMALTARDRFESVQQLEAANALLSAQLGKAKGETEVLAALNEIQRQIIEEAGGTNDLRYQLGKMKQERDDIQGRLHAVDHKCFAQDQALKVAGEELRACQDRLGRNVMERKIAETFSASRLEELIKARAALSEARKARPATPIKDSGENASCDESRANAVMILLGALVDSQRIVTDWLVPDGIKARKAMKLLLPVLDNETLFGAMKVFEKQTCMHSFFAIGDDQMKCTFCGVGK